VEAAEQAARSLAGPLQSPVAELERLFLESALAIARGSTSEARAAASRMAARSSGAGNEFYRRCAERLAGAVEAPPPFDQLPGLLWVASPGD
jgi:hypothetical protein